MAITCSNCGKQLPDTAKFCDDCGTTIEQTPWEAKYFCMRCGAELSKGAKFCLQCGAKVEQAPLETATPDESIKDKLDQESIEYRRLEDLIPGDNEGNKEKLELRIDYLQFDREESLLIRRAERWADYHITEMSLTDWYWALNSENGLVDEGAHWVDIEVSCMPTDKPKAHKLLFARAGTRRLQREAYDRGYLRYNNTMSPGLVAHYTCNCMKFEYNDEAKEFIESKAAEAIKTPDFTELEREAREEAKLFPPPKEIEAEAPGEIMLTFTSDEAAILVYVDSRYIGEEIKLSTLFTDAAVTFSRRERIVPRGSVAVAIFNHIPFVTDMLKNHGKVVTQLPCEVESFYFDDPRKKDEHTTLEEKITVFRGKVKVVDWRGKI